MRIIVLLFILCISLVSCSEINTTNRTLNNINVLTTNINTLVTENIPTTLSNVNDTLVCIKENAEDVTLKIIEFVDATKNTANATTKTLGWVDLLLKNWYVVILFIFVLFFGFTGHTFKTVYRSLKPPQK